MYDVYINVEAVHGGFVWRIYIDKLKRPACISFVIFPRYDTAVQDAKRFRKSLGVSINILFATPTGQTKVI